MNEEVENIQHQENKAIERQKKSVLQKIALFLGGDFLRDTPKKIKGDAFVIMILVLLYISLKFYADSLVTEEIRLKEENSRLRNKQVTLTFELIKASQQSNVEKLLKEYGINIKAPTNPPYVIKINKDGK
jgi:hypothetical protein